MTEIVGELLRTVLGLTISSGWRDPLGIVEIVWRKLVGMTREIVGTNSGDDRRQGHAMG
jgi:hypothetical protein